MFCFRFNEDMILFSYCSIFGAGAAAVAVNVPEKQFPIFALAGISAEQEGQRTGRCDEIVRKAFLGIGLWPGPQHHSNLLMKEIITRISDECQVSTDCQNSRSLHMDPQNQHGSGSSLVVIQQPADSRQRLDYEREIQPAAILSLDQIKAIRGSNEYTEGPSVVKRPAPRTAPRQEKHERTHEIIPINVNNNYEHRPTSHLGHAGLPNNARGPILSRSTSTGSAASSGSNSSASSEQGLLGRSPAARPGPGHRSERAVRTQPKQLIGDDLKGSLKEDRTQHKFICEQCGKCKCGECTAPRTLPSCLACNRQCLCSAESMVEYGTCMCLVKGIFYHCSNDDEGDSYSDNPCSCSQSHCCSSWRAAPPGARVNHHDFWSFS
ncbi:Protein sprouty1 [Manis javanica]|nr:Protein sprouty1 [Manis javanica]